MIDIRVAAGDSPGARRRGPEDPPSAAPRARARSWCEPNDASIAQNHPPLRAAHDGGRGRNGPRPGSRDIASAALAGARPSRGPGNARQGAVRPRPEARPSGAGRDRLLCQRLPRRRPGPADHRRRLAGDAPVAQPQLGPSRARRLSRAAGAQGARRRHLSGPPRRRYGAAARRADDQRPCLPSGRPRRRHLAAPDARAPSDAARTRRDAARPMWCAATGSTSIGSNGRRSTWR